MFGRRFTIFHIFGFAVRLDLSWFVILFLLTWSLASHYLPSKHADLTASAYWLLGLVSSLGLFLSVLLHELCHSLVARRFGLPIRGITLFIFGGVAEMEREPSSPREELWIAIVGPASSLAIAAGCWAAAFAGRQFGLALPLITVLEYLTLINALLAVFNLLPAFPLDGGRVLRSLLWRRDGNLRAATRTTSNLGGALGMLLILLALLSLLAGQLLAGIWYFLIGMFLRGAAASSYQQVLVRELLAGEPVRRFMNSEPVVVPRNITVSELVQDWVYTHHHKLYPVVQDGELLGWISTRQIKQLPHELWDQRTVGQQMNQLADEVTVRPDDDALEALKRMKQLGLSRLLVTEGGRLVGILSLKDLLDFFSLKLELEE